MKFINTHNNLIKYTYSKTQKNVNRKTSVRFKLFYYKFSNEHETAINVLFKKTHFNYTSKLQDKISGCINVVFLFHC